MTARTDAVFRILSRCRRTPLTRAALSASQCQAQPHTGDLLLRRAQDCAHAGPTATRWHGLARLSPWPACVAVRAVATAVEATAAEIEASDRPATPARIELPTSSESPHLSRIRHSVSLPA